MPRTKGPTETDKMHKETGVTEQNRVDDLLPYSLLDQRGRFNKQQTSDPNQDYAYMGNRMRASSNRCDSSAAREPGHTTRLGVQPHTLDVRVTATLLSLYERTHHTVMALSPSASARISQYARAHHSGNRQQPNSTTAPTGSRGPLGLRETDVRSCAPLATNAARATSRELLR